jgi:hypothetical protein
MSEAGIRLTKRRVTQTIDLSDVVGKDISNNPKLVKKLGQAIIDYMDKRVSEGLGLGRKPLKAPYSESYSKSLAFKLAGKSRNDINMRLSGDMKRDVDLLEEDGSKITYGLEDPTEAVKAYAHQTGFEGHPTIKGPKREWFGVTTAEVKKYVLPNFKDDLSGTTKIKGDGGGPGSSGAEAIVNRARKVSDLFDVEEE